MFFCPTKEVVFAGVLSVTGGVISQSGGVISQSGGVISQSGGVISQSGGWFWCYFAIRLVLFRNPPKIANINQYNMLARFCHSDQNYLSKFKYKYIRAPKIFGFPHQKKAIIQKSKKVSASRISFFYRFFALVFQVNVGKI
jgi:hypothetical protein